MSDHTPLLFSFARQNQEGGGRPFRFLNFLAEQEGFPEVVQQAWGFTLSNNKMKNLWDKLNVVKRALKEFHGKHFFKAHHLKVDELRKKLGEIQNSTELRSDSTVQHDEQVTLEMLRKWSIIDESILRQKSRISWLAMGDSNSRFFYTATKVRAAKNKISLLYNTAGEALTDPQAIENEIMAFYKKLLGSHAESLEGIDLNIVRCGPRLSQQACDILTKQISCAEIDAALAHINDSKAPGLDGFNAVFFKKTWHIIKADVYADILDFFDKAICYKPINCTSVTLVPKITQAITAKDFRPIACCTVVYKMISKILTARLQQVIIEVVDYAQAGFIPGRQIIDNILLATELIKGYSRSHMSPRCVIKVDIKKAYASLEWSYLELLIKELGFPMLYI